MHFPAPPILAYGRNRNLGNLLVHTSLTKPTPNTLHPLGYNRPCKSNRHWKLCPSMSNTNSVTNHLTNKTSYTDGGKCNTKYTIYAAECTKHNLLYIGQSSQKLNCRFNGHRSDVRVMHQSNPSANIPPPGKPPGNFVRWSKALPQGKILLQKHGPQGKKHPPLRSILEDLVSLSC